MAVLSDEQVDAAAASLDGWQRADGALRRSVTFGSFLDGIEGVRRVAELAERADHHPDIDIRWRTVTFVLVTHSEGGITDKDVELAGAINAAIADLPGGR
ncbi:MAG: 4a-hydroxytetrahydrobiopterin dehydratase [Mycobacterium sp.]|nr:4a-hydroxytetrahydrobiopterin dehydratase [Mycobacterium sp.]